MIRSLAAALLAACALAAAPALAAGDNSPAVKAFQPQAKEILRGYAVALRTIERGLANDLDAALTNPLPVPETLPTSFLAAYRDAFSDAATAHLTAVSAADDAGSQALNDATATATPGLTVGAGGALDDFRARLTAETARFDANVRKATGKALKKARKALDAETVLTVQTFPLPLIDDVDPGHTVPSNESQFLPRVPLVLMGYGDPTVQLVAFAATGLSTDDHIHNIYDADGSIFAIEQDVPTLPADLPMIGGIFDVTGDGPSAHGNVRLEVFVTGTDGWTRSIGY
jgi:hypothetical protein